MDKLTELKTRETDRQKVEIWLDHIHEHDKTCRAEVLDHCKKDKDARRYYVERYTQDCACIVK